MFRAGILGAGWIAADHVAALAKRDDTQVVAVCDLDRTRAEELAPEGAGVYEQWKELLDGERLDAVWVCLPPPVYETRWGINETIVAGQILPAIVQVAKEKNVPTIDLHRGLGDRPEYFPDKIHPNAVGAGMMAMTIFTALKGR